MKRSNSTAEEVGWTVISFAGQLVKAAVDEHCRQARQAVTWIGYQKDGRGEG